MLSEKMITELNKQINAEIYSGYLYLAMSAYFDENDLSGFAHWMRLQAEEELEHGMKIYDYVLRRGASITLEAIEKPETDWEDELEIVQSVLKHEEYVTSLINNLVDLALEEKDHATNNFLQWFVAEQVEEEENANYLVAKVKAAKDSGSTLFMLDQELAKRAPSSADDSE